MHKKSIATLGVAAVMVAGSAAYADEYPSLSGTFGVEINAVSITESDDPNAEVYDVYNDIELGLSVQINDLFSIESVSKLEPVQGPTPGDDRFLEDNGVFIEELYLNADFGTFAVKGGKFNPGFGTAFNELPGVVAEEISKADYEVAERIGLGGAYRFGSDGFGEAELAASIFFADTSFLSDSIFEERGEVDVADGGSSNTEDLESYAVSLNVGNFGGVDGLNGHLAYRHQEAGLGDYDDDEGFAAALFGDFDMANGIVLSPFVEYVTLDGANGAPEDRNIFTIAAAVQKNKWRVGASYVDRDVENKLIAALDRDDSLVELTAGYDFDCGISVDAGYLYADLDGIESDGVVGKLNWGIEF